MHNSPTYYIDPDGRCPECPDLIYAELNAGAVHTFASDGEHADHQLRFTAFNGSTSYTSKGTISKINDTQWHHVVVVKAIPKVVTIKNRD